MSDEAGDWPTVAAALAPGLLRLAVLLTRSTPDAEDLLQTTFARAHRHGARIASMAAPHAYLRRIMLNELASDRRRRRVAVAPLDGDLPVDEPTESRHDVWAWMDSLPPQQRAAVVLRFYLDLSDGEAAELLGCSPATVRSHVSRGLASLRAALVAEEMS